MRRHLTPYRLVVAGLILLLALIVGLNGLGSFYTDIKPEVYLAPWEMVPRYLSAWTASPYLGSPNFNVGLVPVLLLLSALRAIGLSPEWTFKVFHFAIWLVAAWGAARLTRRLLPGSGRVAGLIAGVLFLANPYTIQGGSTLAIALPMALLPWLLLTIARSVRDSRSWAWPAACGLIFFAMSGMNVAVVPILQLVAVLPVVVVARADWRIRWSAIVIALGKCALFTVGVSVYWLVPSRAALSTGAQIVGNSETLGGISKVSSYSEVLRGLGMWSLYGSSNDQPWIPQFAAYLTNPVIMVLTALWPVLALLALRWARGPLRLIAVGAIAPAAVLMVGLFPSDTRPASPFGHVLLAFLQLPGMSAFRTTNKVGAVLALGFALALGAGVWRVLPAIRRREWAPMVAAPLALVVVAAWILPALSNRLYTSQMDIPAYWYAAAKQADAGEPDARVLFLPGQTRPTYRWTAQRPDDVANSLMRRDVVIPETTPNASAPGGNFLAALDDALQEGNAPATTMSTFARYLGTDRVVLRNDVVWEQDGGARPAATSATLSADTGLVGVGNFGAPGEYVYAPGTNAAAYGETLLSPVQVFAVREPRPAVATLPVSNSVLVAGDGWSIPPMTAAGLLSAAPMFQYAYDVSGSQLPSYLGAGHRLVVTDTNARRSAIPNRLTNGEGKLLTADQTGPSMRTLGTNTDDQTVLVRSGPRLTASREGGAFFDLPYASVDNALDGDPSTSWMFGDFRNAPGTTLTIDEPAPIRLGTIKISQAQVAGVHIDSLTVTAGGRSITQRMPDSGYASFAFGSTVASRVTVTVGGLRGDGYSMVGINDIEMPGPLVSRAARTPTTLTDRFQNLSAADRQKFAATPLDVLLTRVLGTSSVYDDPESGLRRIVSLPDRRTFQASAAVRVDGSIETVYDRLAGLSTSATATSSNFFFHNADARASMAADGNTSTAWTPGGDVQDSWWQLRTPARSIGKVAVTQEAGLGSAASIGTRYADHAVVTIDGKVVAQGAVKHTGTTTFTFPARTGTTVRVTFDKAVGPSAGATARFPTIDAGYVIRPSASAPGTTVDGQRCLPVATVDGQPILMRPSKAPIAAANEPGSAWVACGNLTLAAGDRRIEQAPGFTLDGVRLTDTVRRESPAPPAPSTRVLRNSITAKQVQVNSRAPYAVVIGQSYDSRWHATLDGKDLGTPHVINGYSVGWIVNRTGSHTISISYGPQVESNIALVVSILVLVGALVLLVVARRRGTLTGGDEIRSPLVDDSIALPSLPPIIWEAVFILLSAFAVGWAGAVASVAAVLALRFLRARPWWLLVAGAALVLAAMAVYLVVLGSDVQQVSADAVARSMWPHYLAGGGLVLGLAGAVRMWRSAREQAGATGRTGEPHGRHTHRTHAQSHHHDHPDDDHPEDHHPEHNHPEDHHPGAHDPDSPAHHSPKEDS